MHQTKIKEVFPLFFF